MDEFDDLDEMDEEINNMSEEELDALEEYANREYTDKDLEQDEDLDVSKEDIDYSISHAGLLDYIEKHGSPSNPEGSPLEQYENVNIDTRSSRSPTVEYGMDKVSVDGIKLTGSFPEFHSNHDVQLPNDLRFSSVYNQEKFCNTSLKDAVNENPDKYSEIFNAKQLEQIQNGKTPEGFTWHHHQQVGRMQLVDKEEHDANRHLGGWALWGGEKR